MHFSDLAMNLKASEIRELLKLTTMPEVISFAGGLPAPELFPTEQLKKVDDAVLTKEGREALQYGTTEGYNPLRKQIAARMKQAFMVDCDIDNITITSGSQQGLSMLAQIFINPGDIVLVESPTYLGALNAFKLCKPEFVEVPTDEKGIIPEELKKILEKYGDRVRMMYVIPEFQNPTGITWPVERRKAFMDLINQYDFPVLEDDNMAAWTLKTKGVDAIIVGADRIAANGDTANKIGTYGLSLMARELDIPLYIAAPASTFDLSIADGSQIPIEERNHDEVRSFRGAAAALPETPVFNPAFDVTPHENIRAIVTEQGIIHRPDAISVPAFFQH